MNLSRRLPSFALAALAPLALSLAGCGKDPGNGSVIIAYNFDLGNDCSDPFASGPQVVTEVRVTLTNGGTTIDKTQDCGTDDITIDGVQEGSYVVLIEGLDADGDTIADNIDVPPNADESVSVAEGASASVTGLLNPTPAVIEVALVINDVDGFPQMCADAPLKFFNVRALGQSIGELHQQELDYCTHGSGFQPVPDEMRDINGLLLNRVDIATLDAAKNEVDTLQFDLAEPIGAGKTVGINVTCIEADCSGVLSFPEGGSGADGGQTGTGDGDPTDGGGSTSGGGADSTSGGGADSGSTG